MPLLDIVLGYDCNAACTYCTITTEMRRRTLTTEAVAREIDKASVAGYREIAFTGGEPTIRKDLPALVRFAKKRGFDDIKVCSNGLRYAYAPYLDHLVEAGVTRFNLSAHAFGPRAYEETTRLAGAWTSFETGLSNILERGIEPTLDLILKRDTYERVDEWIDSFVAKGVRHFQLWLVSLTDGNAQNVEQLPLMTETLPHLIRAFDAARQGGYEVVSLHIPRCLLPGYEDHVRHPGAGGVRVVTPDEVFDLRESRLTGGVKADVCHTCPFEDRCPGLRRDYVNRHGDKELKIAKTSR